MNAILALAISLFINTDVEIPFHMPRQTAIVAHAPHVLVDVDAGDVDVRTWAYDKVSLLSDVIQSTLTVTLEQHGNTVLVHAKSPTAHPSTSARGSKHVLYVPASAQIEVFAANGNVRLQGIYGPVSVNVDSGNVTLDHVSDPQEVHATGGSVTTLPLAVEPDVY